MKPCPVCNRKFKNVGLQIHMTKVHGFKVVHDSDSNVLASESKACPVPGCGQAVGDLENHLSENHQDWRLSNGKWVFEV
jgi:hypothetical protein